MSDKKIDRREALKRMGKIAIGAVAISVLPKTNASTQYYYKYYNSWGGSGYSKYYNYYRDYYNYYSNYYNYSNYYSNYSNSYTVDYG